MTDEKDDLWKIFTDEDVSSDSTYSPNQPSNQPASKRLKPFLKCAICGDDAYGSTYCEVIISITNCSF